MRRTAIAVLAWVVVVPEGCTAPAPRPAPATSAPSPDGLAGAFAGLVEAHNRARARAGLAPLAVNERLESAARQHARDMAARRRMSHRGSDGSSPFARMGRAGYTYQSAGENVAYGQRTLPSLMADWMGSRGHRRNILGKYTEIGAAYATDATGTPYWCVTFGTPGAG
ncbi:MAG: CAP domain-containing protein [Planctomycetia bacterium]|nr:CAP domain-containing protein [Planctomycetia bacterium]